jgi:hypothetical protein
MGIGTAGLLESFDDGLMIWRAVHLRKKVFASGVNSRTSRKRSIGRIDPGSTAVAVQGQVAEIDMRMS